MRQPGQSVMEGMRRRLFGDAVLGVAVLIGIGVILGFNAGILLGRFLPVDSYLRWIIIAVSFVFVAVGGTIAMRRLRISEARDDNDLLGAKGERIVADAMDELKRDGYRIFHDIPPERAPKPGEKLANIDHLVIGPAGVFVIETKARSKRDRDNKVFVTAEGKVLINGFEQDRCPINQASVLRNVTRNILEQETGISNLPVRAVVIYPEWYIEDKAYRDAGGDVWVLNEKAFSKWVRSPKESVRLTTSQVELLSSKIEARVRSTGK